MRYVVLALALLVAACQPKPDLSVADYRQQLQTTCEVVTLAYAVFEATASDKVKVDTLVKIRAAYNQVTTLCVNPPNNDLQALVAALSAIESFKAQVAAAKS